ncbi:cupin domain-containing protein [Microbacterium sp.]|uniref:cupin domain-containing protein n=1 Tax=Microbacterium sp. TaxID=51671 RepID=UPI002E33893F|nr:cupin domain-containing protein [Microbacterium sp.]HEX5728485.1 cupin domain-containing protein [Microbacterium sp.]
MYTVQTRELDLMSAHHRDHADNVVRAAWPVHRGTGARSTAAVLFELGRGMRLGTHTDSAEEVLVVLEGEVEIVVGDERRRAGAGSISVVPAEIPHDVVGAGDTPARVTGVFSSSTIVSVFEDEWVPYGTRVLGTPPPAELAP